MERIRLLIKPHGGKVALYVLVAVLHGGANLLSPYFFGRIIDGAVKTSWSEVYVNVRWLIFAMIGILVLGYIKNRLLIDVNAELSLTLRNKIISAGMDPSAEVFSARSGTNISAAQNGSGENTQDRQQGVMYSKFQDADVVASFITETLCPLFPEMVTFVISLVLCFQISWRLTVLELVFIPFNFLFVRVLGGQIERWQQEVIGQRDLFFADVFQGIRGVTELSLLGAVGRMRRNMEQENHKLVDVTRTLEKKNLKWSQGYSLLLGAEQILVLILSCMGIILGRLTIGRYYTFNNYSSQMSSFFQTVMSGILQYHSVMASLNHIEEELKHREPVEVVSFEKVKKLKGQELSFSYGREDVISNVDFEFSAGEIYTISGANGIGKSTLLKLLSNVYAPEQGQMWLNQHLMRPDVRYDLVYFSPDPFLLNGTIAENLRFVCPEATEGDIKRALHKIGADEFVEAFPERYETHVGEGGTKLSKGQLQAIALARLFLIDGSVFLFDEATSHLDEYVRENFMKTILELKEKGKMIFLVTHRQEDIPEGAISYEMTEGGKLVCLHH